MNESLEKLNPITQELQFSSAQLKMIRDTYANGCSESEFEMLMHIASARRLNPLFRQIWFVKRPKYDPRTRTSVDVWSAQVSIDGLRCIAERSGLYDGQDEPEFTYVQGNDYPVLVKVRVYKKGIPRPFVGVAHFSEYVAKTRDGAMTTMWKEKPHIMISKCAESIALRKAFPEDMAGLYVEEEMDASARHEEESDAAPRKKAVLAAAALPAALPEPELPTDELKAEYEALLLKADEKTRGVVETWLDGKEKTAVRYTKAIGRLTQ